jgi:AbrB family looped-hinge helix DNA binding protein
LTARNVCPYTEVAVAVTIKDKAPLVIPDTVRRRAGLKPGDEVEFKPFRGGITVLTKPLTTPTSERLTLQDAGKIRHALKQVRDGKTTPWSQVKHELGL